MTPKQTSDKKKSGKNLRGEWLYDFLMVGIEPDLLTQNVAKLENNLARLSPAQRSAKLNYYERAFVELDRVIGLITEHMATEAQEHQSNVRTKLRATEKAERAAEESTLQQLFPTSDSED